MNNTETMNDKLALARTKLEVFTDLNNHFAFVQTATCYSDTYKECAEKLYSAILEHIDPIKY